MGVTATDDLEPSRQTNVDGEGSIEPLFAGRIDLVTGSLWSAAIQEFNHIPNDKVVLTKWTLNTTNDRITIYTLEKKQNKWERWIRVWDAQDYPVFWDYMYCPTSPDTVDIDTYQRDLVCSLCYELDV
jgi:hypothetical protein